MNVQPITREYFIKRLTDLCLRSGLSGFPRDNAAQHILLKSAVLLVGQVGTFTEKEINEKLKIWINQVSQIQKIDHIILRRMLVDAGYLTRTADGSCYQVSLSGPQPEFFDASVDQVDVLEAIRTAQDEITRRKREYVEKQTGKH